MFIPLIAEAKIVLCKKTCSELRNEHIEPIKGLIYELSQRQGAETKKQFAIHAAKTIVWIDKLHKDEKIYNLEDYKNDDRASLVNTCIKYIISVVNGQEGLPIDETLNRWGLTGKRVVAEYKEEIIKKQKVIKWKLELSKI
jgi:hypothetical protein